MAASMSFSLSQVLGMNRVGKRLLPTVYSCLARQIHQSPVLEGGNSRKNLKYAPPAPKEKEKYVSRRTIAKVKEQQELRRIRQNKVFISDKPVDDVWLHEDYPSKQYDLSTVIDMHRELAAPAMFDNMDGMIYFSAQLNMKTKKKTKFLGGFEKTVLMPNPFEDGSWNRVVAFANTVEEKTKALEAGASFAGGFELIKSFEQGELKYEDDYDHVVCTSDMLNQLRPIRKILKDCVPDKRLGSVGDDLELLVKTFLHGKKYKAIKLEEDIGRVNVSIGKLSMPTDQLEENFNAAMDAINSHKSAGVDEKFMSYAMINCPPSPEEIFLKEDLVLSKKEKEKLGLTTIQPIRVAAKA